MELFFRILTIALLVIASASWGLFVGMVRERKRTNRLIERAAAGDGALKCCGKIYNVFPTSSSRLR